MRRSGSHLPPARLDGTPLIARERVAGYETKARVVDLLRFGRSVDIHMHGHDQYGRTLAHIVVNGRDPGEQLVREKLALPYRSGAEAKAARVARWCGQGAS
jgi:endonuclease YncB( thermonuclease family)